MSTLAGIFALRLGTPLGVNGYTPLNLGDLTARCTALTYSTIGPGGFEALTASFGPDGVAVAGEQHPYGNRYQDTQLFGHCELVAGRGTVWEGRIMKLTAVAGRMTQFVAQGYGVSGLSDGLIVTTGGAFVAPRGLLALIAQTIPLFSQSDYEAPYDLSQIAYSATNGLTGAQALDLLLKFGDQGNLPLDWFVWDRRYLTIVARRPKAQPDYQIPEDSTVTVNVDATEAADTVIVSYTDPVTGVVNTTPPLTNPDFVFNYGLSRTRIVSGGTGDLVTAEQFAAAWLALHAGPTYQVHVTRDAGRGLETYGGGERPAYLVRAGEWLQIGSELPMLPIMRTQVNAVTGKVTLDCGALGYDDQQLVGSIRRQLAYLGAKQNPNTGLPF